MRSDSERERPVPRLPRGAVRARTGTMRGRRILYVDDDEAMLRIVAATLPRLAAVEVVTAATGARALALMATTHFDLFLLDYELPDFDGADLCAEIRGRVGAVTPVVFLSGHEEGPERDFGLAAGASAFLAKTSSPAAISAGIAPLLRTPATVDALR